MVPVSRAHAGLALHEVGDHLELLGVHVAVAVQVEHLEGDLKVAPGGAQHRQQKYVVGEGYQATCAGKKSSECKKTISNAASINQNIVFVHKIQKESLDESLEAQSTQEE